MERFNNIYTEFLEYLLKNLPSYKKYIIINKQPNDQYILDFIELNLPYMEEISMRNSDIFIYKYPNVQLIKGLKFKRIIDRVNNKKISSRILESIWRQLHILYVIAYNSCNLEKIVKKNYSHNTDLSRIIEDHNIIIENIMLSGPTIIEKSDSESYSDTEEEDDEEQQLRRDFEGKTNDEDDSSETVMPDLGNLGNLGNIGSMFENSLIGNLAKELSEEINPQDLGINTENIKNPADIISNITSCLFNPTADGGNKLQNIAKIVSEKLDNKVKSGQISKEQLGNEIQNMMGSMMNNSSGNGLDLSGIMQQMGSALGGQGGQGGFPTDLMASMMGGNNRKNRRKINKHRKKH